MGNKIHRLEQNQKIFKEYMKHKNTTKNNEGFKI